MTVAFLSCHAMQGFKCTQKHARIGAHTHTRTHTHTHTHAHTHTLVLSSSAQKHASAITCMHVCIWHFNCVTFDRHTHTRTHTHTHSPLHANTDAQGVGGWGQRAGRAACWKAAAYGGGGHAPRYWALQGGPARAWVRSRGRHTLCSGPGIDTGGWVLTHLIVALALIQVSGCSHT